MDLVVGNLLILFGDILLGVFTLGFKRTPSWRWEDTSGVGSVFAYVLFALPLLLLTVPNPTSVYHSVPKNVIVEAVAFGLAWGIGGVLLRLSVDVTCPLSPHAC